MAGQRFLWLGLAVLLAAAPLHASPTASLLDVQGHARDPLENQGTSVLFFVAVDCANSNMYAPEFNAICKQYAASRIGFWVVQEDPDLSAADAQTHARDYGFTCTVVLDPQHTLAHRVGAKVTPEVAVTRGGQVCYLGRIDDRFIVCGQSRGASTHDLRDALDAMAAGGRAASPHHSRWLQYLR